MDRNFQECYLSRLSTADTVFPFLWLHGEDRETLTRELEAIRRSGATEFCAESRTYEDFCKDKWWEDFKFLLDYARSHGMRVWLLDDKHFPTGYANGYLEARPELQQKLLRLDYRDLLGPVTDARIFIPSLRSGESLISVTAWRRSPDFRRVTGKPLNLMPRLSEDGSFDWSVPEGGWRIYYVIASTSRISSRSNYIDMLSPESCQAMIHAVYQPMYEHFRDYFGNTFRGFFSDEPGFYNGSGGYYNTVGTEDLPMPWRADLPELIGKEIGMTSEEVCCRLPALWHTLPQEGASVRAGYMDVVTRLYEENFSGMLGNWCRERKVLYIGHVIEDMNSHQRLGVSAGHYFRSLRGQDMSGIDIVLHQMIPFELDDPHTAPLWGKRADPHFFHYMLAKLGASLAHLEPKMENRAMAEVFGAFGWAEGVGYMKYLADHMLANGINHFVPHAFTPKYPDPDCPPHFYANGKNPQFDAFSKLTRYMQKVARLTADSVHKADVAVFYSAQGEWTGGKYALCQETCCRLTRDQIDFDIIPEDFLYDASVADGRLSIHQETYGALIVPYCEILPDRILDTFVRLAREGLPVIFSDRYPSRSASGKAMRRILSEVCPVVPSEKLTEWIRSCGFYHITAAPSAPFLRSYRVDRGEHSVYLFFNEGAAEIDTMLSLDGAADAVFYDVWKNVVRKPETKGGALRLRLAGGQAIALLCGGGREALPYDYCDRELREVSPCWKVSLRDAEGGNLRFFEETDRLIPFNRPDREPDFCGTIRYECTFSATGGESVLDLGRVGEIASVTLNGTDCGTAVAAPYRFEIRKTLRCGENQLTVEVVNSPAYRERKNDRYASYLPVPPSGLLGPIKIG